MQLIIFEYDPGSKWTLQARLTHVSQPLDLSGGRRVRIIMFPFILQS